MNAVGAEYVLKPVAEQDRVIMLDILRGLALLGILTINISTFSLPDRFLEGIMQHPQSINYKVGFIINVLFEGKMRALFSMIFGAGLILFIRDKEKSGKPVAAVFYSRMAWLSIFGLAHAHVLLWGGDILYLYSLCGMGLFFFRNAKPSTLIALAFTVCLLEAGLNTYFFDHNRSQRLAYLEVEKIEKSGTPLTEEQNKRKQEWKEKEKGYYPDDKEIEKSISLKRSDYLTMASAVRQGVLLRETRLVPILMLDPVALMLLGMALFQWGFLTGKLEKRIYIRTLIVGYGIGIPLVLYSWFNTLKFPDQVEFLETHWLNFKVYAYPIERTLVMLGHVSLVVLLVRAGVFKSLFNALAAVGRMAFSNYILQSVICSVIFYGYGLGYFARLEYYETFYIVIAIWIGQLIVSPIWLTYFRFGPLEWAWRSLTYWKRQPMRLHPSKAGVRSVA